MEMHTKNKQEDTENLIEFGKRLRNVMYIRDISNRVLAQELCVSASTISGYRNGRRSPSITDLVKISRFLNISADYLLGLTDDFALDSIL